MRARGRRRQRQRCGQGTRGGRAYRVFQGGEADEAQEELPARGHGHRGVDTTQGLDGSGEVRSQALHRLPWMDHTGNMTFVLVPQPLGGAVICATGTCWAPF